MNDAVVITGLGAVTPLANDVPGTWAALLDGVCAAREWPDLVAEGFPIATACRVALPSPDPERRGRDLAGLATAEAIASAGLEDIEPFGVYVGTTMGESAVFESADSFGALDTAQASADVITADVADAFDARGPQRTVGTACAAGNYAIGIASDAIRSGRIPGAVVVGVEPFSRIAMLGFARMRAMAPHRCRPFDRDRQGMQIGEAAGALVLESASRAAARSAPVLAEVRGYGLAGDAFHPTAPREDGSGMAAAMVGALADAGVGADQVDWICAHGTGTPRSDAAEAVAIRSVFGDEPPPVSSIKGAIGHSMGAATAVEAVVCVAAIDSGVIPPTVNLREPDPELGIVVPAEAQPTTLDVVVSCGYAFGGLNSAIVLGRPR